MNIMKIVLLIQMNRLGSVVISNKHTFLLVTGILNLLIGLLYWIISFLPSCPCPKSATESWQNWQEYSAEGMDLDKPDTVSGVQIVLFDLTSKE